MSKRIQIYLLIILLFLVGCSNNSSVTGSLAAYTATALQPTAVVALTATNSSPEPIRTVTLPPATPTTIVSTATVASATVMPLSSSPPPLGRGSSFVYDQEKGEILAFGGSLSGVFEPRNETWAWDGSSWKRYQPKVTPPARANAALVYDPVLKKVVLFGGAQKDGQALGDMWAWDGQNWTRMAPVQSPTPRAGALMVYDASRNEIVLFGGYDQKDGTFTFYSETWVFDGSTWKKKTLSNTPLNGEGAPPPSMVYDAVRKKVMLWQPIFGIWVWNGTDWDQFKVTGEQPPLSIEGQLGYDEAKQVVLLRGSDQAKDSSAPPETWLLKGEAWAIATEGKAPGPKSPEVTILYDSKQQKLEMVAFLGAKGSQDTVSIWAWDESGWQAVYMP